MTCSSKTPNVAEKVRLTDVMYSNQKGNVSSGSASRSQKGRERDLGREQLYHPLRKYRLTWRAIVYLFVRGGVFRGHS